MQPNTATKIDTWCTGAPRKLAVSIDVDAGALVASGDLSGRDVERQVNAVGGAVRQRDEMFGPAGRGHVVEYIGREQHLLLMGEVHLHRRRLPRGVNGLTKLVAR
ncbi:hypothetical protein H257_11523 [Aphanomyces astaci]|uniref:Uncharacterized protein n=1 Tax=Aphanomyces astaci TaxID=112090 RepID=W4G4H7_APHAT|nr:hypothetical protein H257_11523 [Aphanomyces astaci]ETV73863.1 hypothetical protein H257_11523 [Aphanomyces astaci]|eukprot:XP_009836799.1 hypothetical protein H257_11523 [Aphanomyces astaci]